MNSTGKPVGRRVLLVWPHTPRQGEMDVFPRVIEDQDDLDVSETIFPGKISRRVELPEVMS